MTCQKSRRLLVLHSVEFSPLAMEKDTYYKIIIKYTTIQYAFEMDF